MRRPILILLMMCLILVLSTSIAFADNNTASIRDLMELGFTQDEITNFSSSELEKYSNMKGKLISKDEKYYRVSKDEGIVEISKEKALKEYQEYLNKQNDKKQQTDVVILSDGSDTESCSWLRLTTTVSDLGDKAFFFKNSFQWLKEPIINLTDVIGMTHNSSISVYQDTEYLKYYYDRYTIYGFKDTVYDFYGTANKKDATGYAFKFDIKNRSADGYYMYKNNRGYMVYNGIATPSTFKGYSNAYGHYSHQRITSTIGISLTSGAMTVSPSSCFDSAPDTDAQFKIE